MPHPLAGCYLEVLAALYGLKESNRLFALAVTECLKKGGFHQCPSSPCTYIIQDSDHGKRCVASTHVDDFRGVNNDAPHLVQHLRSILKERFEEVTDVDTGVFTGVAHTVLANGAIFTNQNDYIRRVAGRVGVVHLPPVHLMNISNVIQLKASFMLLQYIRASELLLVDKLDGLSNFNISLNNCSYINVIILYTIAIPSDQIGIDMVMNALLLGILINTLL